MNWSLIEPDAKTALVQYRKRDRVEKQFDMLKHMIDERRLRTNGPTAHESIVFIRFLSLIITEYVRTVLKDTPIKEKKESAKRWITRYTVAGVFNRLESYTEVSFKGRYKPIRPTKTKAQREISKIFELDQ